MTMITSYGLQLGVFHLYWYSLCLLFGVGFSFMVAQKQNIRLKAGLTNNQLTDLIAIALAFGIIGGRLGFVAQNVGYFKQNLSQILNFTSGGLSIHGAILTGLLAVLIYARRTNRPLLVLTDLLALPLLGGQIFGRLGNYFNQELFGYPTQLPWKIFIAPENRPSRYELEAFFHPTFLYEMLLNSLGFWLLWRWKVKSIGQLTGGYLIIFALTRFIVEFWRISDRVLWNLSAAQLISLGLLAISYPLLTLGSSNNIFQKFYNSLANFRQNRN